MQKQEDSEYRDLNIKEVRKEGNDWSITTDDGWSFFVSNKGVEPHVGDRARFYGKGVGSIVRGLDINGQEVFYRTPEQQEEENQRSLDRMAKERRQRFENSKEQMDADYRLLPVEFQRRLDGFRRRNPDFRWEHEPYELMCCKDAVKIAKTCPTEGEIKFFIKQDSAAQRRMVPTLDDGHSGNSFGAACRLAWLYVTHPELVEREHGALCPLVGCDDYGCASLEAVAA